MKQSAGHTYNDFYKEVKNKPRRTEKAEREEIEQNIAKLWEQNDFWSIDLIRKLTAALADQDEERGYSLLFITEKLLECEKNLLRKLYFFVQGLTS